MPQFGSGTDHLGSTQDQVSLDSTKRLATERIQSAPVKTQEVERRNSEAQTECKHSDPGGRAVHAAP